MKVTFNVDNGANIHSCRSKTWDLSDERDVKSFGFTKEEWLSLSVDEKHEEVNRWAQNHLELYFEEDGVLN